MSSLEATNEVERVDLKGREGQKVLKFVMNWYAQKNHAKKCDLSCKSPYQQYTCKTKGFTNKTGCYCFCMVGQWMCKSCHPTHITDITKANSELD